MGRGKLALELIGKEKSRKITYEKRKRGLVKKAKEFSILCGVDTCMIIYGTPEISERPEEPEIWPPDSKEVERIIQRYRNEAVDCRTKRSIGLPDFFLNRKKKLDLELAKARSAIWRTKYPVSDDLIAGFSEEQLRSLLTALGSRLEFAKKHLAALKEKELASAPRNNIEIVPMAGFDFNLCDSRHSAGHSFFLQGAGTSFAAGLFHEPRPVDMKLPHEPRYVPNMSLLELPQLGAGFCSSILHHQSQAHPEVASSVGLVQVGSGCIVDNEQLPPLDAPQLQSANGFNHHHHHFAPINYHQLQNGCVSRANGGYSVIGGFPGMHEQQQQETCGEFGSMNLACFCDPTSSGPYCELPVNVMKQLIPGRDHQFQLEFMNMKADPSLVQMQASGHPSFNQFHDTTQPHA